MLLAIAGVVYGALGRAFARACGSCSGWPRRCSRSGVAGALLVRARGARARLGRASAWRYGIANLARRRAESIAQIVAFGLGIMLLLALAILRDDLVTDWRASLPVDVPNYFFVNIPPDQRADFEQRAAARRARI